MRSALLLVAMLAAAGPARADQCAWINQAQAVKAAELLRVGSSFVEWCEPCGEKPPSAKAVQKVENIKVAPVAQDRFFSELAINGKGVDLAYLFVMTRPGEYENLAKLSGCPATGVSKSFRLGSGPPPAAAADRGRTFQEMESEAGRNLRALFIAQKAYRAEYDRYERDLRKAGFQPEACPNGSRPGTPSDEWVAGCNFIYRVELDGREFTGRARCVSGAMVDEELIIRSGGENPGTPLKPDRAKR